MSMTDVTRGFLTESVHTMNKMGLDPYANYKEILSEDALFNHYSLVLSTHTLFFFFVGTYFIFIPLEIYTRYIEILHGGLHVTGILGC